MKNNFKNKKVLVMGLGINQGGLGVTKFFASQGANLRVTDLKTREQLQVSLDQLKDFPDIEYILGEHRYEDFDWADLIIKNPGVKPGNPYIEYATKQGKDIEMDMGIFLEYVSPSQIIGITGTKGKSTTSTLTYEVLKAAGKNVVFAGNIGKSVLDTIPFVKEDTLVVLEISSFQLEAFDAHHVSPHISVITNIHPDHLNYYKTMEDYIQAKRIIAKYQTPADLLFLKKDDPITTTHEFLEGLNAQISYFSSDDLPKDFSPKLPGEHNRENMAAVLKIATNLGIDQAASLKTIANFTGVEFRLQLIKEWNGIKIYNDTAATGPEAGIQALKSFPNCILIAGGMNKNMPYEDYVEVLEQKAKKIFFLIGDSTDEIKRLMKDQSVGTYDNLETLLKDVKKEVSEGDIILFSPAATSFNLFQNEFDRGRKFNEAVERIFK